MNLQQASELLGINQDDDEREIKRKCGHPVFLAQHATGCCCRSCLYKWHRIPQGVQLTQNQQDYVVDVLMTWIEKENTGK